MENKPTITARMDAAGVSRTLWYEWIQKPGFSAWWKAETEKFLENTMSDLFKIGYLKSASDYRYFEAMIMRFGGFSRKGEVKVEGIQETLQKLSKVLDDEFDKNEGDDSEPIPPQ
jgi:hypothetical protein